MSNQRRRRRKPRQGFFSSFKPITNVVLGRALLALVLAPSLVYVWMTTQTARDMRMQNALDRNQTAARLTARLLDERCQAAVSVLKFMAQRNSLADSLSARDQDAVQRDLRSIVQVVPDLFYAAVHTQDFKRFAGHPNRYSGIDSNPQARWRREITGKSLYVSDLVQLPDHNKTEAITVVMPLGNVRSPRGYLVAYYSQGQTLRALQREQLQEGVRTYITTLNGNILNPERGKNAVRSFDAADPVLTSVKRGERFYQGSTVVRSSSLGERWVGYAYARSPRWVVMVTQPPSVDLAASNFLILRFAAIYLPVIVVMVFAVRALSGVYHRQEQMANQLAEQNKRLMASDRTKSEFLANVSHDLWTPLAGLQLSITGLLDPKVRWTHEQIMEHLQLASDEVDQLTARVRNLLEMARLESDTQFSQKEPCDLADIVGSALERLRPLLKDRRVDAVFPSGPLMIECRHAQLEMVVMNLLENALKYTPPQSPLVVRGEMREDDVYFSLRDYGPGVDMEEAERIFEKFYRGKPSRHLGGTGLGLAICKAVIESHGGVIGVMNAPGGGAEFWFSVPALEPVRGFRRWTTQVAS